MGAVIDCDLHRKCGRHFMVFLVQCIIKEPAFRYVYLMCKTSAYHKRRPIGIFWRFLLKRCSAISGMQISPEASIGKGFPLIHRGQIVISHVAVIDDYCTFSQCLAIGVGINREPQGWATEYGLALTPSLWGDLGTGSNVLIGPNAYVNFDVPDNSIVIGNPGEVIESRSATEGYIENML